jgi:hypothetical protein
VLIADDRFEGGVQATPPMRNIGVAEAVLDMVDVLVDRGDMDGEGLDVEDNDRVLEAVVVAVTVLVGVADGLHISQVRRCIDVIPSGFNRSQV